MAVPGAAAGEMSMTEAQRVLKEEAGNANLLFSVSFYFEEAGRPFSALRAAERAIAVDGQVPGFHARLGQLLAARKRLKDAAAAYGRAADMDPATKSFRAAEARALAGCLMLPEAAASWQKLLDGATDRQEVLDAARNLSGIRYRLNDPAGAEAGWTVALGKLTDWNDRLAAADGAGTAVLGQKAVARAMEFWDGLFAKETDWDRRAQLAERMRGLVGAAAAAGLADAKASERAEKAWRKLLDEAGSGAQRQRAALAAADVELRSGSAARAVELLRPAVYASGDWGANHRAAQVLARALAAAGQGAEVEKLWREFLGRSGGYDQRSQVAEMVAACLGDDVALIEFRREMAKAFPDELSAQDRLAEALAAAGRFAEAADVIEAALPLIGRAQGKGHHVSSEYGHWSRLVDLCCRADDPGRALALMQNRFAAVDDPYQVSSWLSTVRGVCGEFAALGAADRLAGSKGIRRLGAGQHLLSSGQRELARGLFDAAAAEAVLSRGHRRGALQSLMNMARSGAERVALARRMVELGGENRWERQQGLSTLAMYLGQEGEIADGAKVVRQADALRERNWRAGPEVLGRLAGGIFQGSRVGRGLRTPEGQKSAEEAAEGLYREFSGEDMYRHSLAQLVTNLAELHARRGDYDGAVGMLRRVCAVRDWSQLRLAAAGLLERRKDDAGALAEYLAYADAAAAEHAAQLARHEPKDYHPGVNFDGRFLQFLEDKGRDEDYLKHANARLEATAGRAREGHADLLLAFLRGRNRPEDMEALLKRLVAWGHTSRFYRDQQQWVAAAIRMKNAASQADAQRREQLLQQANNWQKRLGENPEDYGAAINVYKTYVLLGRRESDGQKYLDIVKDTAVKQRDPLVLELWGREMMLEKSYAGAVRAFELAAEVTGRRMDYEESLSSALELSGKHKEAISLALDSLAGAMHGGRGFRTVEQILDMAERSDNLKHLYAEVKKRAEADRAAGRALREAAAQLALRLAWDNADDALAGLAIDELAAQGRDPSRPWQDEWRLADLAGRATERRRLADAARVRRLILDAHAAAGYAPDMNEHQQLAGLLLEAGRAAEAADLMFSGLERAGRGEIRPVHRDWRWRHGRGDLGPAQYGIGRRDPRAPWVAAILGLAAREAHSGGSDFTKACGGRLPALVEAEMKLLERSPAAYAGPLLSCDAELGLGERVTAAFRAAAAAGKSSAADHLALARRLVNLAAISPKEQRPAGLKLEEVVAACQAAAERTEAPRRGAVLMETARLYARLLAPVAAPVPVPSPRPVPRPVELDAAGAVNGQTADPAAAPEPLLAGATPELVLEAYEAAAAGRADQRWGLDALREALAVAQRYRLPAKALEYARKLYEAFPANPEARHTLAGAQLAAGEVKPALALLHGGLAKDSPWSEFVRAGDLCMTVPENVEAAAGASGFYNSAIAGYIEEVGRQVDPEGKPLPDAELGRLQAKLSAACAAEGAPEAAFEALVASLFNSGSTVADPAGAERLAEAYARAGKAKKLAAELEARVKADPGNLNLRLAQATVLEKSGDYSGAAAALGAAKALKPELSVVRRLIEMLRKAGQTREALAECRSWASSFPRDGDAYRAMAEVYKELKDEPGEVVALTMLVEVAPREAANCRQVAVLFAERRDWPRALALAERAMELRPEEPYRHIDVAEVLFLSAQAAGQERKAEVPALLQRAGQIAGDALARDWEKGLSPELLARMPPWKGTFETRAHSLLGDIHELAGRPKDAARERLAVPAGYRRPALKDAVPTPGFRNWWRPGPMPMAGGRGGGGWEE